MPECSHTLVLAWVLLWCFLVSVIFLVRLPELPRAIAELPGQHISGALLTSQYKWRQPSLFSGV